METLFAKINAFGDVENVIVATPEYVVTMRDASSYVQTWVDANGDAAKCYNYAVIGGKFDAANKAFMAAQPFKSWTLDAKFLWQPPVPQPAAKLDSFYTWDEATVTWKETSIPTNP
jgi:hypothetical protein